MMIKSWLRSCLDDVNEMMMTRMPLMTMTRMPLMMKIERY